MSGEDARDFMNGLRWMKMRMERMGGMKCKERVWRENSWNRGAFKGRCGNLVWLKLPGIYESDPNEFLVMKDTESQQAISSSQESLLVEGQSCVS